MTEQSIMRVAVSGYWLLSFLALAASGCGARDERLPVYPARGQVLYEGKPIPHAFVVLHPLEVPDVSFPRPRGTVQEDGSFVLETYGTRDGAPAGEYAVTVEWWLSDAEGSPDAPPTNRLPARYARTESSGLRVRVEAEDNEIPTIPLSR
jgi:hypothetical protein